MHDSRVVATVFELIVAMIGAISASTLALFYLRRVRLERPAIGTFNRRDVGILFCFIVALPVAYQYLPHWALTFFLGVTFAASLSIGYRPLLSTGWLWLGIGLLIGTSIWLSRTMLGTVFGWQLAWFETDIIVVLGAVSVANLYAQGGMRLRHVAWFALILSLYDGAFTLFVPLTNKLAEQFLGYPLDPSIGMRYGLYNASIGLGDLLVYALFMITAFKAYGRVAARLALVLIALFGAVAPALAPLLVDTFIDARTDLVVPAQTLFGPAAFLGYLWLKHRYGRERTMQEFLASTDIDQPKPVAVPVPAVLPAPQPASA
ncbi:MAG: hypothetical protein ABI140_21945 [Jatrophihabitantaceae bacterium]